MSVATRWDTRDYGRIVSAEWRDGVVVVRFGDRSWVSVEADQLLPPGTKGADWNRLSFNQYEIVVPTADSQIEIPWSSIRSLTDREYGSHLAEAAGDEARQIGLRIKELRDRRKLSGKELAERAGISPQSLSRIEHGRHDVVFTTLQRILAAMGASLKDLAAISEQPMVLPSLVKRLESVGIDREFLLMRLLPRHLRERVESAHEDAELLADQVAAAVGRVYRWSTQAILGDEELAFDPAIAGAARFKALGRANELRAGAYTVYANYIALAVLDATHHLRPQPLPTQPAELRRQLLDRYGALDFESLLRFAWDSGVPVVPLHDPGGFHGACWRVRGRSVVVLKQVTRSHARWANDLAHELKHVASHLSEKRPNLVESEEISPLPGPDEEGEASAFATELFLYDRAEDLTQRSVDRASGSMERLKFAVQRVAAAEHVPVDSLANYVAFRLSRQGLNWWGAANNLQTTNPAPWQIARDMMIERTDASRLNRYDQSLLARAIEAEEDEE